MRKDALLFGLAFLVGWLPRMAAAQEEYTVKTSCPTASGEELRALERKGAERHEKLQKQQRRLSAVFADASALGFFNASAAIALDAKPPALTPYDHVPDGAVSYPLNRPIQGLGVPEEADAKKKAPPKKRKGR